MDWSVQFDDAYRAWVRDSQPSVESELRMMLWLIALAENGPPPQIGDSSAGFALALGPSGEQVEFSVIPRPLTAPPKPPWGIIGIRSIN